MITALLILVLIALLAGVFFVFACARLLMDLNLDASNINKKMNKISDQQSDFSKIVMDHFVLELEASARKREVEKKIIRYARENR